MAMVATSSLLTQLRQPDSGSGSGCPLLSRSSSTVSDVAVRHRPTQRPTSVMAVLQHQLSVALFWQHVHLLRFVHDISMNLRLHPKVQGQQPS